MKYILALMLLTGCVNDMPIRRDIPKVVLYTGTSYCMTDGYKTPERNTMLSLQQFSDGLYEGTLTAYDTNGTMTDVLIECNLAYTPYDIVITAYAYGYDHYRGAITFVDVHDEIVDSFRLGKTTRYLFLERFR